MKIVVAGDALPRCEFPKAKAKVELESFLDGKSRKPQIR
jgi:hypothetical protein